MGFLDFIGKAANIVGGVADVASQFIPGLGKVANIAKGVGGIANAYSQGRGQREAISGFIGDTFGKGWGNLANTVIGTGEQIFKGAKSVTASPSGFRRNPIGTIQNMASAAGRIGNIIGGGSNRLSQQMRGMGGVAGRIGNTLGGVSRDINTIRNGISAGRQQIQSGVNSIRSAFR